KRNRFRRDLVRCGTISYEEFIKWREVKPQTGVRFKTLNDALVKFDSSRYTVFEKNRVCVGCGKPGSYFAIERQRHHITWHLNFYMLNKEGVEILMTKDHIFPRSRGGKNTLSN